MSLQNQTTLFALGNYIYLKTAENEDTDAIIRTPWFKGNNTYCISFNYHLFDRTAFFVFCGGAYRVYAYEKIRGQDIGVDTSIVGQIRNRGDRWITVSITYTANSSVEVSDFTFHNGRFN